MSGPVEQDLARHMADKSRTDMRVEMIEKLADSRWNDSIQIAAEVDEIIGEGDVNFDGNTQLAAGMAAVLMAWGDEARNIEAAKFFAKLLEKVNDQLREQATIEVDRHIELSQYEPE